MSSQTHRSDVKDDAYGIQDIINRYARTFSILQQYDDGLLVDLPVHDGGCLPTRAQVVDDLSMLQVELMDRAEATELFAQERDGGLESLLGNLDQSVFGEPAYPSVESKAAHFMYFVIKNHPFADGNKRSGAFLLVDFLYRNHRLFDSDGQPVISATSLAALAILIAESSPDQKDTMIRLIMNMIWMPDLK